MAVPLLLPAAKALLGAGLKAGAKKALMNKAKDVAKNKAKKFVSGKLQKRKKGGALAKTERGALTKKPGGAISKALEGGAVTSIKEASKVKPEKPKITSADNKVGFEKINIKLLNLSESASTIDEALKGQYAAELEENKKRKKAIQDAKRNRREAELEEKKPLSKPSGTVSVKGKFSLMDFIKNVLLGGLLLAIVKNFQKIVDAFNFLRENLYAVFLLTRASLQVFFKGLRAFKGVLKGIVKAPKTIGRLLLSGIRTFGRLVQRSASGIANGIKKFGKALFKWGKSGINKILRFLGLRRPPTPGTDPDGKGRKGKVTPTAANTNRSRSFRGPGRYRLPGQAAAGGTFRENVTRQNLTRRNMLAPTGRPSRIAALRANMQTGTAFGGRGAGLQRGLFNAPGRVQRGISGGVESLKNVKKAGNSFLKKIFNIVQPDDVNNLRKAAPTVRKASNFMRGVKIPVAGPIIVFAINALDPDVSMGKAAFKAIGAGIGEVLGFITPIPGVGQIIGPILGGLAGEVLGGAAYELIINKNPKAAGEEIVSAFKAAFDIGKKVVDAVKDVGVRFFDALPKFKIPEVPGWVKRFPGIGGWLDSLPIWGKEIINPLSFVPPMLFNEVPKALLTAIFQPDKNKKGAVEKPNPMDALDPQSGLPATSGSSGTDAPTASTSTPAASGPNAAEERAKRKLAFLLRSSATIDKMSLAKKGSGAQVVVPGVGTYVDGRNFFGQPEGKYFDTSGNKVSKQDFDRNVSNQMKIERKIMEMEKEKKAATMVSPSAPASPGTSTPMSAPTGTLSQQQAFKMIYDLAKADGRAKFPEVVAAQAMHETGYLVNPNSVYFASGKTNPFGQTGDRGYGTIPRAGDPSGWTLYPDLKTAVSDHISLWHLTNNNSGNYNAFDTILQGIASVAPAYSPNADPANIRLGYTVDAYSKGVVRALKVGGFDPKATAGQASQVMATTVATTARSTSPLMGVKNPQETDGAAAPVSTSSIPTGTGLKEVVPTANLKAAGVGGGAVGFTSGRGQRWGRHHAGVDIGTSGQKGWYVAFKLSGVVSDVGTFAGYGKTVIITAGGKDFLFAHLAKIMVSKGQSYNGEIIGEIGNTGAGTGEHLHFEVSPKGTGGYHKDEDPMPYVNHLVIGRMGDGSAVGTQGTTLPQVTPTAGSPTLAGAGALSGSPTSRNLEQFPSYDGSRQNIILINQQGQMPTPPMPSAKRSASASVRSSTSAMLNSYYKRQLLGLLYKVG